MKKPVGILTFVWILLVLPLAAKSFRVYTLNIDGNTVSVIDPVTNKVVHTIDSIPWPRGSSFSPDGSRAYICSESEHTVDVVDTKTFDIIKKVKLSGHPSGSLVITKDGKHLLVPMNPFYGLALTHHDPADSGGVDVIDTASLERVKTLPMKDAVHDLFRSPDGKYAIAGSATANFATVIDLQTFEPAWKIPFPSVPLTMVIERGRDGSSSRIFAEVKNFNGFVVADFKSGKELQKIEFADPIKYRFGALKNTSGGKNVTATEYNPTHGTDISPDGKILWVTSRGTNYLYAYSLPDLKLIAHIFLPSRQRPGGGELETGDPHWLVPSPDGKSLYVGLAHFNSLIVIDTKSMKVVDEIPVGKAPKMIDAYAIP